MSAPSSTVQPSRCARWPIVQSAPTTVSSSRVQWSTAPSCTDVRAPITMRLWSPRSTACGQIVDAGPDHDVADDRRLSGARRRPGRSAGRCRRGRTAPCARESSCPGVVDVAACTCKEVAEQGYTIVEDAIEPELVDALRRRPRAARAVLRRRSRPPTRSRATTRCASTTCSRSARLSSGSRCTAHVLPIVDGVLDPGCLISSLSSIAILPGETAQPIHADDQLIPIPKPHPPTVCNSMWALTDFTEANGATRLVPGLAPLRPLPRLRRAVRLDRGRDAEGLGADLARQPVARRRREHHRRDAHRHRDELLRGLHPPAGEPAARLAARDGRRGSRRGCASSSATASTTC